MEPKDTLTDRRAAPRVTASLPARLSDYLYEWEGRVLSLSAGGCFVSVPQLFAPGKELSVSVTHPDGDELTLDGIVRWARGPGGRLPAGLGIAFDRRHPDRIVDLEDFVERLAVSSVELATRYRAAGRPLPLGTELFPARDAPRDAPLTPEERAFLAAVGDGSPLHEIRRQLGESEWHEASYAAFSLQGKGLVTTDRLRAGQALSGGRPAAGVGRPAPSVQQVRARTGKAQSFYQQALDALNAGDKRLALTNLRLALMLAPGDPEITAALADLED